MAKVKYDKKEYLVRDSGCKRLVKTPCFLPFSGNGIPVCRRYELGQCPSMSSSEIYKKYNKPEVKSAESFFDF
jgi:hypothetical protein